MHASSTLQIQKLWFINFLDMSYTDALQDLYTYTELKFFIYDDVLITSTKLDMGSMYVYERH